MASDDTLFDGISEIHVAAALQASQTLDVPAGRVLIAEFDTTDAMFLLESGSVTVLAGGVVVAKLLAGAVLGEIGLFTMAVRTASVIAAEPSRLRRLDRDAFDGLRDALNPVAFRIERRALLQLSRRLRAQISSLQAVASAAPAQLVPVMPEPAAGTHAPLRASAVVALLGTASDFSGEERRHLRRIAREGSLRVFAPGQIPTDEQGEAEGLRVLLQGRVDGLAKMPGRSMVKGMVRVCAVGEGELFNISPTVDGEGRAMWFVVQEEASVLYLDSATTQNLFSAETLHGSVLRLALIRSLFDRLTSATAALKEAHQTAVAAAYASDSPGPVALQVRPDSSTAVFDAWFEG